MKKWIFPFIILFLCACGGGEKEAPRRAIQYMEVSEPGKGQLRRISGVVEPGQEAELSFQVAGHVANVSASLGDSVQEGQVLATLDNHPYQLSVDAAKAEVTKASAVLAQKKADYDAKATLFEKKFIAKTMMDAAEAEYHSAQQNVEAAHAKEALALRDLNNTSLKAPFTGDIATRKVDAGMNVVAGQAVFRLVGKEGFEVSVSLPEGLRKEIRLGMPVQVAFPSLGTERRAGEIFELAASTEEGNAFVTKINVPQGEGLYSGLTAEVWFEWGTESPEKGYLIPASAMAPGESPGQAYVFVFDSKTETVKKTRVSVKDIRANSVEVTEGLKPGDVIATAGVHFLTDGQSVTLYKEP